MVCGGAKIEEDLRRVGEAILVLLNSGVAGLVFVGRRGWREVSIQPNAEKTKERERERERDLLGAMSELGMGPTK